MAFHRVLLPPDEVAIRDGIPVTTVASTIFDLAPSLQPRRLERLLNEAEIKRLWDTLSLEHLLHRYPGRPGSRAVRALLDARKAGTTITRSELEVLFLEFADRAGLPRPRTNQLIEGLEVDLAWREQRLIVELDGYETHSTRAAFERDRERSRILQAAHWRAVPVTYRQLCKAPHAVERDLRRMLGLSAFTLAA